MGADAQATAKKDNKAGKKKGSGCKAKPKKNANGKGQLARLQFVFPEGSCLPSIGVGDEAGWPA